jgi:hypothetical protein
VQPAPPRRTGRRRRRRRMDRGRRQLLNAFDHV